MNRSGYLQTGQITCHDVAGCEIDCSGAGQDGELRGGYAWPVPRFLGSGDEVID